MPEVIELDDNLRVIHHGSGAIEMVRAPLGTVVITASERDKFLEAIHQQPFKKRFGVIKREDISGIRLQVVEASPESSMTFKIFIQVGGKDIYALHSNPTVLHVDDNIRIELPPNLIEMT